MILKGFLNAAKHVGTIKPVSSPAKQAANGKCRMSDGPKPDRDALVLLYRTCCEQHRFYLRFHAALLIGYLAGMALIPYILVSTAGFSRVLICTAAMFVSGIVWFLSRQHQRLHEACLQVASKVERELGFSPTSGSSGVSGLYSELLRPAASSRPEGVSGELASERWTWITPGREARLALDIFFGTAIVAFGLAAFYWIPGAFGIRYPRVFTVGAFIMVVVLIAGVLAWRKFRAAPANSVED